MPDEKRAHLRIVGKDRATDAAVAAGALAAIEAARDAADAFQRLQSWSVGLIALSATADVLEEELHRGGREVMRLLLEESIRARGVGDVGSAVGLSVTAEVELRLGERREHGCALASMFGSVEVRRLGYGRPGVAAVHPLDESLNLPRRSYSYPVQERVSKTVARSPYDEAITTVAENAGVQVPKRQVEEIAREASCDFDAFYEERVRVLPAPKDTGSVLVAGIDCKGVPRHKTPEELAEPRPAHLGKGEKRQKKKMATVASVHTTEPHPRSAEDVVSQLLDPRDPQARPRTNPRPKPQHRRVWASIEKDKTTVIGEVAEEMKRRDPDGHKTAVCLTDGEKALQRRALDQVAKAFPGLLVILDIMHVLSYLWKAAHSFEAEGSEAARQWVRERLLLVLQGRVSSVVAGMRQSATKRNLSGGDRKAVDAVCNYMLNNKRFMQYHDYLAKGLPIASGSVEGACGHLVRDRMERTGAIWKIPGAEAILRLRAIDKCHDFEAYWQFHLEKEHARNYPRSWRAVA